MFKIVPIQAHQHVKYLFLNDAKIRSEIFIRKTQLGKYQLDEPKTTCLFMF